MTALRTGVYGSEEFAGIYAHRDNKSFLKQGLEENFVNIELLAEAVSKQFNVTIDELRSADKRRELVTARAILARAAQLLKGMELRSVCEILQKHHGTISRLATAARKDQQLNDLANQLVENLS